MLSKENKFKFNFGNELNEEFDWDMYETPNRNYDPQIGRFFKIDPLTEKYNSVSPYIYALNNPIIFNDPNGAEPYYPGNPTGPYPPSGYQPYDENGSSFGSWMRDMYALANMGGSYQYYYRGMGDDYMRANGYYVTRNYSYDVPFKFNNVNVEDSGNGNYLSTYSYITGTMNVSGQYQEYISMPGPQNFVRGKGPNYGNWLSGFDFVAGYYNDHIHNHNTYTTTKGVQKPIYKSNGVVRSERAAKFAKISRMVRGVGLLGSVASTVYSGTQVYNQYQQGGVENVNGWNVADAAVGTVGVASSVLVTFGIISNPVGWVVGAGVLIYGGVRLAYDIYHDE
jgi:RHS repeat-associated protein